MNKMKDWLLTTLGGFGMILYYAFMAILWAVNLLPMIILDFPIWLYVVISVILWVIPYAQIPYLGIWIWAFVVALKQPIDWISIVFFVAFAIYFGNMLFSMFSSRKS